ncbi:MAG: entericidin A/B family lipoprotein [Burkholderiaceae bacterium]
MKKLLVVFITAIFAAFAGTACNTVSGVGKDIEAAGGAVDKAATDTKKKM